MSTFCKTALENLIRKVLVLQHELLFLEKLQAMAYSSDKEIAALAEHTCTSFTPDNTWSETQHFQ